MKKVSRDKVRLFHIADAIQEVEKYLEGIELEDFLNDSKTYFATIKQLEIIGEAENHLDPVLLKNFSSKIDWKAVINFRNVMVHEYFAIKPERVWETVKKDLPILKPIIQEMTNKIS